MFRANPGPAGVIIHFVGGGIDHSGLQLRNSEARILLLHPIQKVDRIGACGLHPLGERDQELHRLFVDDGCLGEAREDLQAELNHRVDG